MNLDLKNQTAVIIGAAQGIGLAIAEAFARESANVVLIDLKTDVVETATRVACETGVKALGIQADASKYADMQAVASNVLQTFGSYQHVVMAAGVGSGKFGFPFWNLEPSDWPRVFQVNVFGAVNVAHAFTPTLVTQRAGTIQFIASVAGQIGSQSDPPYSASKAALINFSQCAAKDLAPHNVRVNTICPGMVRTELSENMFNSWLASQPDSPAITFDEWAESKIKNVVPLGRWQSAEEIANMCVFLASDAAANITGQTINVDGGYVMHW
ncbi:MAG: SDR family oxidoreductase [Chthonomonadales bacterium]